MIAATFIGVAFDRKTYSNGFRHGISRTAKKPAKRSSAKKTKKAETAPEAEASSADKGKTGDDAKPAAKKPARRPRRTAKAKEDKPAGPVEEKTVINIPIQVPDKAGGGDTKTNVINVSNEAGKDMAAGKTSGRKGWWNRADN